MLNSKGIAKVFQSRLGEFFHGGNLNTVIDEFKYLVSKGLTEMEAFDTICKVFDAAKSEYGDS